LASKNSEINEISQRIITVSAAYSSNKEFLDKCGISNHSLITDLKKGRIKNPGADILVKIVRGTGCNGSWLLTGKGRMFDLPSDHVENGGVSYIRFNGTSNLIEVIEKKIDQITDIELTGELELKLSKLLVKILEHRVSKIS